jgi:hypothetical protein
MRQSPILPLQLPHTHTTDCGGWPQELDLKSSHPESGVPMVFEAILTDCRFAPSAIAGMQRGVCVLIGLFKFHSVALCGRLDSLPRRTTFRFRNSLHLLEARGRVAYVGGIFQRFLASLGESKLGCGYPITNWLG